MSAKHFALALSIFLAPARYSIGANLLQNPDFDGGLIGWSSPLSTATMNGGDGSPAAPSAQLTTSSNVGVPPAELFQCVSLAGSPPPWDFGMRIRLVDSIGSGCVFQVFVEFFSGTCATSTYSSYVFASAGGTVSGVQGDFTQYSAAQIVDPQPGGAASQSASLWVIAQCGGSSNSITLNVDNAYLASSAATPVRLQSFDIK